MSNWLTRTLRALAIAPVSFGPLFMVQGMGHVSEQAFLGAFGLSAGILVLCLTPREKVTS